MRVITEAVERLFADSILYDDSENKIDLLGEDKVGYLSIHYVVTIDSTEQQYQHLKGIKCEIQIRTVLQDAWARVFHDRLYKGNIESTSDAWIKRKTNLLSGSLELIDSQIDEIVKYYDSRNGMLSKKAYQNLLNEHISEKTLQQYCSVLSDGNVERFYSHKQVEKLLSMFGVRTIRELDYCVNDGFVQELKNRRIYLTIDRFVRYILFLFEPKKLLSMLEESQKYVIDRSIYNLMNRFVNMEEQIKEYDNLMVEEERGNTMSNETIFGVPVQEVDRLLSLNPASCDRNSPIRAEEFLEPCLRGGERILADEDKRQMMKKIYRR